MFMEGPFATKFVGQMSSYPIAPNRGALPSSHLPQGDIVKPTQKTSLFAKEAEMKITRRTDYAIHLIADLSEHPDSCIGLRSLAEQHGVTYAFARTVQQGLLKAGIIRTSRGINGGIALAKPLDQITILEVFEAAQGTLDETFDTSKTPWCSCEDDCLTDHIWIPARRILNDHFSNLTMHHLLSKKFKEKAKEAS
jgi:Rrf2 family protein